VTGQPQPRLHLGPVMAGMQHSPPEHPNSLSLQAAEEGPALQPPGSGARRQLRQPSLRQPDVLIDVYLDNWLLARRQQFFDGRLLGADELGAEKALGETGSKNKGLLAENVPLVARMQASVIRGDSVVTEQKVEGGKLAEEVGKQMEQVKDGCNT
jgi:hypothetical protein